MKNTSWGSYYTVIIKKKDAPLNFSPSHIYCFLLLFFFLYPIILHKKKIKNHANYSTTFIPTYNLHPVWQLLIHLPRNETGQKKKKFGFYFHPLPLRGFKYICLHEAKNTGVFTVNVTNISA